jgi:hypothetical protein
MLEIAFELAAHDPTYEELTANYVLEMLLIARAMNGIGPGGMWDEEDGFYYDVLRLPDGSAARLKVRSMVGLCRSVSHPVRRAAQRPICRQLPVFTDCRRGEAAAGSGGKRGHRSIANKLVGRPQRAADATEAELPASAFAQSQRVLMAAERVVSKHIVRPARVAPSCTEYTRPPTGRSRSGSRTTPASSWAAALCPTRTESGMS